MCRGRGPALPQVVAGAVALIPADAGWTRAERDRWFDLFVRIVDFVYPVEPPTTGDPPPST